MQGNLNEIDIRSILQLIELGQRTGELFVETYSSPPTPVRAYSPAHIHREMATSQNSWFVFCANGQLVYAGGSIDGNLTRLREYLRYYQLDHLIDQIQRSAFETTNAPEYGCLWQLLENHLIAPEQGRSILRKMVHETLFDLLSLHQGSFIFDMGPGLSPQLMTLEMASPLSKTAKQVQEWKQFYPHLQSPHQCPAITDLESLQAELPPKAFNTLNRLCDGKTSLRQMSRYLHRDLVPIARAIHPYIKQGWVQLLSPAHTSPGSDRLADTGLRPATARVPRIVCIDDERTIRKTIELMLKPHGYEITSFGSSLKALSLVFPLKPDLILCDIAMPEPDGYELCAMLRKSRAFRQTPIIMLTGRDGFIDRVRARMVGATDYLTKPFGEQELIMLLETYIGPGIDGPVPSVDTSLDDPALGV
ncbi:response regulator [Geitlerinema sp. P-1104]|uniref:response regulator n=1 Tax=Geitlerinema sp. P-1104 TaxID=2546230 RepID=UPI001476D2CB|nr:response regulator [Geitlerinema sp. P-1104]NMG58294.1 response regulator [Geitlerinema sp. P-1104]